MTAKPTKRTFPRTCLACRAKEVNPAVVDRTVEMKYDGTMHTVSVSAVPMEKCGACGEETFGLESEAVVHAALRRQLGLLSPEEIRSCRTELGLTQSQLAASLGMAAESISRWESGTVLQSKATDRHLRGYFGVPQLRELYERLDRGAFDGLLVKGTPPIVAAEPSELSGDLPIVRHSDVRWITPSTMSFASNVGQRAAQGSPFPRAVPPYTRSTAA
jgi:putative zinc finger/helix-turn-helix YgiT family protein